jgi:hypothetical protein
VKTIKDWLLLLMGLALAGVLTFEFVSHRRANPVAPTPAALGRAYATTVVVTLADAWVAAADALEKGKTVVEARTALQDGWQAARTKAFVASVAPEFAKVLPEASEPKDNAQRAQAVALWREFARGLKGGR